MTEQHDRTPEQDVASTGSAAGDETAAAGGAGTPGELPGSPPVAGPGSNPEKDPADWVTGDEPMTGPQRSYLQTLSREAGVPFDESLLKAQASRRIDELQAQTGRGASNGGGDPGR